MLAKHAAPVIGLHGIPCALGDDDGRARVTLGNQLGKAVGDVRNGPLNFRHNADFRAGAGAGLERDVAAVAAHDLHNGRAVVGAAGRADGADIVHTRIDGGVVAERHLGIGEVVVDGAGDTDTGDAKAAKRQRALIGTVAADDDNALHAHFADIVDRAQLHFGLEEIKAAGGAQIRAGLVGDIKDGIKVQLDHVVRDVVAAAERAVIAALDADQGHAVVAGGLGHRHDGGIHAGGVAAGGQNTDSTHAGFPPGQKSIKISQLCLPIKHCVCCYYTAIFGGASSGARGRAADLPACGRARL